MNQRTEDELSPFVDYTAEDAIKLIKKKLELSLTNLEMAFIIKYWDDVYQTKKKDVLATLDILYTQTLPHYTIYKREKRFLEMQRRQLLFEQRISETNLDKILESTIPQEELFSLK